MRARTHGRSRALLAGLTAVLTVLGIATAVTTAQAPPAQAITGSQFDPSMIISDAQFYDSGAMNATQVQAFLDAQYTGCATGYVCLRDYATATTSEPAEDGLCAAYTGQPSETAAQIIANVGTACGINPQVLLVLLQKESSLVTTTTPSYQTAAGFGCPDSTGCNAKYYGFFNQVYLAARQYRLYRLYPTNYNYVAGRSNYILYNPKTSCGGTDVVIANQATAGLYDYTPYQPNAAALANLGGTGDKCSAYGNRNFWYFFNTWFPTASTPHVSGGLLLAKPDGTLWYYANTGDTNEPYLSPVEVGARGWQKLTHVLSGDIDGDGLADVVATRANGTLWLYHNGGNGLPFAGRVLIGHSGWAAYTQLLLGDVDGDGRADLVAETANGALYLYLNTGNAARPFGPRVQIGASGWQAYPKLMLGDVDGDGRADLVATGTDGSLSLFHNSGSTAAPYGLGVSIGARGWGAFDKLTLSDVDGDGLADLVGTKRNGTLWLYLNATGRARPYAGARRIGLSGWQAFGVMVATDVPVAHPASSAADLLATKPAGSLWRYPNQRGVPFQGGRQVGRGFGTYSRLLLGDVDGDGRADLIGVKPNGTLWLYRDSGSETHPFSGSKRREIGRSGWQHFTRLFTADVNGDGRVDLVATRADGTLWLYRNTGNAAQPFRSARKIGASGWGRYNRILAADLNGDGKDDLIATRADGSLVRYLSNGTSTHPYGSRQSTALSGWQRYRALAAGDVDGDGRADLIATRSGGTLWLDRDGGTNRFPKAVRIGGSGWQGFDTVLAADVTGDGLADLLTRTPGGILRLYVDGGHVADPYRSATKAGVSGWQKLTALSTGDVDHDGDADIVGVRTDGSLWLYRQTSGTASPLYRTARAKIGASGWDNYDTLQLGDVTGDGYADLIARKPDGTLWLYKNTKNPSRPFTGTKSQIGSGFGQYDTVRAGDVDGDALADLVARSPDGTLWLYHDAHNPAKPFPSRVRIGSGFQSFDKIAVGDVDGDGRADLLAAKPDGTLWLFRSTGLAASPYPAHVEIGKSGWTEYDRLVL